MHSILLNSEAKRNMVLWEDLPKAQQRGPSPLAPLRVSADKLRSQEATAPYPCVFHSRNHAFKDKSSSFHFLVTSCLDVLQSALVV